MEGNLKRIFTFMKKRREVKIAFNICSAGSRAVTDTAHNPSSERGPARPLP